MLNVLQLFAQVTISEEDLKIPKGQIGPGSLSTILQLTFGVLGSVAFLIVVVAGLKFVLSRGSPDAVAKARNTIIYAAVGLVICMLSFAIVRFVVRGI